MPMLPAKLMILTAILLAARKAEDFIKVCFNTLYAGYNICYVCSFDCMYVSCMLHAQSSLLKDCMSQS